MRTIFCTLILIFQLISCQSMAIQKVRVKDVVKFEGIRDNLLIGYGLVVGLNGTGDTLKNSEFTKKGLEEFLVKLGISTKGSELKTKNVAAVTVTAVLPPFSRVGSKIDVKISALGDAKNLQGGTLLATPMLGADGEVYAVSQGAVSIAGFKAKGNSQTISKGVTTSGFISNGAIIEKEINFALNDMEKMNLSLNNPDISTAFNLANVINDRMKESIAVALDPGTVQLKRPTDFKGTLLMLLAQIEQMRIDTDQKAQIIIEESTGTIVITDNVRIDPIAISQGNLSIKITETYDVDQPNPFAIDQSVLGQAFENERNVISSGTLSTIVTPQTEIEVDEQEERQLTFVESGVTLRDLVKALNSLGVGPRDLISILQNIKSAGALHADIIEK